LITNVWISYAINGELEWLAHYVVQNRLLIYGSPLLLAEIKKVLQYAKVKKLLNDSAASYMDVITAIVLLKEDIPIGINSPDPDDDYVFELAISNKAKAIVCGDKPLLYLGRKSYQSRFKKRVSNVVLNLPKMNILAHHFMKKALPNILHLSIIKICRFGL